MIVMTGRYTDINDYIRLCVACHRRMDAYRRAACPARQRRLPTAGSRRATSPVGARRMIRFLLTLTLAAAILAVVLLSAVLLPSTATDYPEGNIHN